MLLALTLEVCELLPLLLNLLKQSLTWFKPVFHSTKYWLNNEPFRNLPSILSKVRIYEMPVEHLIGKPAKQKSPAGRLPAGLNLNE